jgi:threonine dehydrogenase-like Zn-dependent dehydrogenase
MRGFLVTGAGEGSVRDVEVPVPGPGQALIRLEYAGICGGDPDIFAHNNYGATPENPRVYGHEFYGEIVAINNPENRPSRVKVGDMAVGPQDAPCGICDQCVAGRPSICTGMYGTRRKPGGCFGEYFERDVDRLFPIAPEVDPIVAAIAEPLAVAVFDIRNSGVGMGDSVLVIGAGTVGILTGLLARYNGAGQVLFAEISERRIEFMKSLGFDTCNSGKDDVAKIARDATEGRGMDFVFETSGSQPGWNLSLDVVRKGGTVVPVGLPYADRSVDFGNIFRKEIVLLSVNMHQVGDFAEAAHLLNRGDLNKEFKKLVTSIWPLEQTLEALRASSDKNGNDIKILLQPGLAEKRVLL